MKQMFSGLMLMVLFVGLFSFTIQIQPARAAGTIVVPDDYATIQAAINAANPGDTIYVRSGIYPEHIELNKSVTLTGESNQNTIIEPHGSIYITASNVTVENFNVTGVSFGDLIFIDASASGSSDNVIRNNNLACPEGGDSGGVDIIGSTGNIVEDNQITVGGNSNFGIALVVGADNNTVNNNTVRGGWVCVAIEFAGNNTVSNNSLTGQTGAPSWDVKDYGALYLAVTSGDTIQGNTFVNNTLAINPGNEADNCLIYNNNFINNTQQALIDNNATRIAWDNGYPSSGNYWSDYSGIDLYNGPYQNETGSDGIGDTPYTIDMNNIDHYPLMNPNAYAGPMPLSVYISPHDVAMYAGQSQLFNATVTGGVPPYTYEWYYGYSLGTFPISGETNPTLNFTVPNWLGWQVVGVSVTDSAGTQGGDEAIVSEFVFGAPVYFTVEPLPVPPLTNINASINGLETPPTPSPVGENFTVEIHLRNATATNVPLGVSGVEVHFDLRSISDYCTPIGFTDELGQTGGALVGPLIYGLTAGFYDQYGGHLVTTPPYTNATLFVVAAASVTGPWYGEDGLVAKITFQITGQPSQNMSQPDFYAPLQLVYGELADASDSMVPSSVTQGTLHIDGTRTSPAFPGDLNGDGKVSLQDLQLLAQAYNSHPGDPNWNPLADLAAPYGIISLTDLVTMAMYYGQHT